MLQLYRTNRDSSAHADDWEEAWKDACDLVVGSIANATAVLPFYHVENDDSDPDKIQHRKEIGYFLENNPPDLPRQPYALSFMDAFGKEKVYNVLTRPVESNPHQIWRLHLINKAKRLGILRYHPAKRHADLVEATNRAKKLAAAGKDDATILEELTKSECGEFNPLTAKWECKSSPHEDDMCGEENGVLEQGSDLC